MLKAIEWNGERITKPGLYARVPLNVYHSARICDGPSISSSGLRTIFRESPLHFFCEWPGNPNAIERTDTKAFRLGRAAHHLLLGEKYFAKLFVQQPLEYVNDDGEVKSWNNNARKCKEWNVQRRDEGRSILTDKDVEMIKGMAIELGRHPIVRSGALNGAIERSLFWKDKATGVWIKCRPDSIPTTDEDFVDLKTTQSVIWTDLVRTIGEYGYHQQGALIRHGARELLKMASPTFTLVFVESKPPHAVRVVTLKDNDLDRGDKANRYAIDAFARCIDSGKWPGPGGDREDAEHIELSEFEQKRIDDRLTILGGG